MSPQQRLDRIVTLIASNRVADVCSVYFNRAGETLELFATVGLAPEAVHQTRMAVGEGLVGTIAAQGKVINTADAQTHPNFRYFPETGEEIYQSFLGVPILRAGRVVGVLTVQNRAQVAYGEEEIEAMQVIATLLAEMFATGELIDQTKYADITADAAVMRRLDGSRLVEGVAIGHAWLHEPRVEVTRLLAESPPAELARLERAVEGLRESLDQMLATSDLVGGEQREVLEAYRLFAQDRGWLRRIREAIGTGLSAEAAVRRVQEETRVRIGHASDPYLRERLIDLDDIANRLLRHLVGKALSHDPAGLPDDTILIARNLGAADLLEYDRKKLRGVVLEEGSKTAHVTIVARAIGIPMVGRIEGVMDAIDQGNQVALDGDNGHVYVRPNDEILTAFQSAVRTRAERKRFFDEIACCRR
ncbi:MAG: phosphoenolpyruvate-utilizing N-terminal domain-containing protein [Geminicoccaceae bacterium]